MLARTKKHILLLSFIFSPNIGGVESHLDDLCSYLVGKGYKITAITYQPIISAGKGKNYEKKGNLEIIRIPWLRFNLFNRLEKIPILEVVYLVPTLFIVSCVYLLKNGKKIDVIQVHGFNMAIVGALLNIIFHKKFVVNTHVSFNFIKDNIYSKILFLVLDRASKILVLTNRSKDELLKIGISQTKILVYHQWIDTTLFYPKEKVESRKRLNLPKSKFIVFFAGRFVKAKGIDLLLRAAKKINKNIILVFVGSGPLKEKVQLASQKSNFIRFVGRIEKEDLPFYYSAADITIIPSFQATSTYAEGIPRVMVESLTCGTPVLATKTGGVREILNRKVGFFVKPTSQSIADTINDFSLKRKELEKMKGDCTAYALHEFGIAGNAKIIESTLL